MPLTSIVFVILRISAFWWLVQGIAGVVSVCIALSPFRNPASYACFGVPAVFFVMGGLTWFLAGQICRMITPRPDPEVNVGSLSLYDLSCFAFVFLGLSFVLSSLAEVLVWLHFFCTTGPLPPELHETRPAYSQLTKPLITLVAGGASLVFAPRLARALARLQRKVEKP